MVTEDPERERLFARVVEHMPGCAEYSGQNQPHDSSWRAARGEIEELKREHTAEFRPNTEVRRPGALLPKARAWSSEREERCFSFLRRSQARNSASGKERWLRGGTR